MARTMQTPEEVASKWAERLGASVNQIRAGVQRVTEAPTAKAAAAADLYVQGVQRAVQEQRFQDGCRAVSLQAWQQATIDKGLVRVADGAAKAKPKMAAFQRQWLPHMAALQGQLAQMPKGTTEAAVQRVRAAIEHAKTFRRVRQGQII